MASMVELLADTVVLPIRPDGYTVADIDALPESHASRYELVDGVLFVSPMPARRHQLLVDSLGDVLKRSCPPDLVVQPLGQDVRSGERTNVVPDLLVDRVADIDLDAHVAAAPLLVVEVVSPSSRRMDLFIKVEVYEEMGIPSYWVIHPAQNWIKVYQLGQHGYELAAAAEGDDLLEVSTPFPVSFRPTDLLGRFRGNA